MTSMKKVVVLTGAGVSRESGIKTFRDSDGMWENYRIEEVCTAEAIIRNRDLVIDFYNMRRKELFDVKPNAGHFALADLEKYFDVEIITQNVDNLHERSGSTKITHLHGELTKLRSSKNPDYTVDLEGWEQDKDALAPDGSLLRPFIVFFNEPVPMIEVAANIVAEADIIIVTGTSLLVYPAASLLHYAKKGTPIYLVDPNPPAIDGVGDRVTIIRENSGTGLPKLRDLLIEKYS